MSLLTAPVAGAALVRSKAIDDSRVSSGTYFVPYGGEFFPLRSISKRRSPIYDR